MMVRARARLICWRMPLRGRRRVMRVRYPFCRPALSSPARRRQKAARAWPHQFANSVGSKMGQSCHGQCPTPSGEAASRSAPPCCSTAAAAVIDATRNSAARLRTRRDEPVSCGNSNKRRSRRRADHAPRRTCSLSASYCRANVCHRAACYSPTRPRDRCSHKAPQLWRSWRARLARTRWPVCRTQVPEPGLWRAARNALQSRGGDWVRHRGRNR